METDQTRLERRIVSMCESFTDHLREQAERLDRWPEEGSPLSKVLLVVDELRRCTSLCGDPTTRLRRHHSHKRNTTTILTQAFLEAVDKVDGSPAAALEDASPIEQEIVQTQESDVLAQVVFPSSMFRIAEVFRFLDGAKKSGRLIVPCEKEKITVELHRGEVVNAYSDNAPPGTRLGEILVKLGAIMPQALEDFVASHRSGTARLGAALEAESLIEQEDLFDALGFQMKQLINRCLEQQAADITFELRSGNHDPEQYRLKLGDALAGFSPALSQ